MLAESLVVTLDGLPLHCLRAGSGPAVVLVHSLIGSAQNWDLNLPALARGHTVYALDLPYMGASHPGAGAECPELDASLAASADRLARWADALGIAQAHWVGASHGGAQVMMLAARYPQRVRSLMLFAPANPFCGNARALIAFYNSWLGGRASRLIPYMPRVLQNMAHTRVYGDPRKVRPESLQSYTGSLNPAGVRHTLRIVRTWWADMAQLRGELPAVARLPVLLVWGSRDGVVGIESAGQLAVALHADLHVLDGPGHLAFTEEADECNAIMLRWLAR